MVGARLDWTELRAFLHPVRTRNYRRSTLASSFVAVLELAKRAGSRSSGEAVSARSS
jgi:hypothetical protein